MYRNLAKMTARSRELRPGLVFIYAFVRFLFFRVVFGAVGRMTQVAIPANPDLKISEKLNSLGIMET